MNIARYLGGPTCHESKYNPNYTKVSKIAFHGYMNAFKVSKTELVFISNIGSMWRLRERSGEENRDSCELHLRKIEISGSSIWVYGEKELREMRRLVLAGLGKINQRHWN